MIDYGRSELSWSTMVVRSHHVCLVYHSIPFSKDIYINDAYYLSMMSFSNEDVFCNEEVFGT